MSEAARHWRRAWSGIAVAGLMSGGVGPAWADDAIGSFFQQIFGGGGNAHPASEALPQPDYAQPVSHPLTVRMRKHRRPTGAARMATTHEKYTPEELKNVTIYTDRTLVPGDAVMTAQGVRIFNGAKGDQHAAVDFVALSPTTTPPNTKMSKTLRTELIAIDNAARSDFRSQ